MKDNAFDMVHSVCSRSCTPDENTANRTLFPKKLYSMLADIDGRRMGLDVISWTNEGDAFVIYNPTELAKVLLPRYFQTDKFSSFQRQLNAYGFKRTYLYRLKQTNTCASKNDLHVYKHDVFHRNHPELLDQITRKGKIEIKPQLSLSADPLDTIDYISQATLCNNSEKASEIPCKASLLINKKNEDIKDVILDAGTSGDEKSFEKDDFYLQLPLFVGASYSLSDWDAEKESLNSLMS